MLNLSPYIKLASLNGLITTFQVKEGPEGSIELICPRSDKADGAPEVAPDRIIRPEEVSSHIIRHLLEQVKDTPVHGQDVIQAVITVPAHFNPSQRRATVEAAMMAGLKKVTLLQGQSGVGAI